jgi:hypothetical protein
MTDALKVQIRRPAMKKNSSRSVEMKATVVERKGAQAVVHIGCPIDGSTRSVGLGDTFHLAKR